MDILLSPGELNQSVGLGRMTHLLLKPTRPAAVGSSFGLRSQLHHFFGETSESLLQSQAEDFHVQSAEEQIRVEKATTRPDESTPECRTRPLTADTRRPRVPHLPERRDGPGSADHLGAKSPLFSSWKLGPLPILRISRQDTPGPRRLRNVHLDSRNTPPGNHNPLP